MIAARWIAYFVAVFLNGIGLSLLIKPELATGPMGPPLFRNEPRAVMAVVAAREMVLGLIAAGLAYTQNYHALLLALAISLLIVVIDGVALFKTKSYFGFVVNDLVGLLILFAVCALWRDLRGL